MKKKLVVVEATKDKSLAVSKQIVQACEEVKATEVVVLDVASVSDFADYFIVASGRSDRQVQGITNRVIEELAKLGVRPLSVEGYEDGQWVLIDCGDVVAHIFYGPVRSEYDLESLWMRARKLDVVRAA
jgi:ribosome-associated protein